MVTMPTERKMPAVWSFPGSGVHTSPSELQSPPVIQTIAAWRLPSPGSGDR